MSAGKGDKRRPGVGYQDAWGRIFGDTPAADILPVNPADAKNKELVPKAILNAEEFLESLESLRGTRRVNWAIAAVAELIRAWESEDETPEILNRSKFIDSVVGEAGNASSGKHTVFSGCTAAELLLVIDNMQDPPPILIELAGRLGSSQKGLIAR